MPFLLSFFLFLNGGVWTFYAVLVGDWFLGVSILIFNTPFLHLQFTHYYTFNYVRGPTYPYHRYNSFKHTTHVCACIYIYILCVRYMYVIYMPHIYIYIHNKIIKIEYFDKTPCIMGNIYAPSPSYVNFIVQKSLCYFFALYEIAFFIAN